jgi:hypothetical protein
MRLIFHASKHDRVGLRERRQNPDPAHALAYEGLN